MAGKINYLWRLLGTFISFAIFAVAALVISYLIIPWIHLRHRDSEERLKRCQKIVQQSFRFAFWYMQKLKVMQLRLQGVEKLLSGGPYLILANHPSFLDVVLLVSLMPRVDCVVKTALLRNFFVRKIVQAADYISNDPEQDPAAFVESCIGRLKAGRSLIIFPEGTRSPIGQLRKFRRGPALIAIRSGCPVLPVVLHCSPPALLKGQSWYHIPDRAFTLSLRVGEPMPAGPIIQDCQNDWISGRRFTTYLQEYFETEVMR